MARGQILSLFAESFSIGETVPITSMIGFFLMGILVPFSSPELWQRIYASKNSKTVRNSFITSAFLYIIVGLSILLVGLAVGANIEVIDPDLALVYGFANLLPAGLVGLGLVMLLAAVMSSADTYLFTGTSIILQDFYSRFRKISEIDLVKLFRWALFALILVGMIVSWFIQNIVSAAWVWAALNMPIAIPIVLVWPFKKISKITILFGIATGLVATLFFSITAPISEDLVLNSIIFTAGGLILGGVYELGRFVYVKVRRPMY
jgi:solute:Na+ symporter, SSS family